MGFWRKGPVEGRVGSKSELSSSQPGSSWTPDILKAIICFFPLT